MLQNLRAEMARHNISSNEIAKCIGKTDRNVRDKLNGKYEFSIQDAKKVRDKFFPDLSLEYLFSPN